LIYEIIFLDLQEGIKKNSVALKCEVEAMKKATEEGSRIEGRDQRIKIHFVSCKLEPHVILYQLLKIKFIFRRKKLILLKTASATSKRLKWTWFAMRNS